MPSSETKFRGKMHPEDFVELHNTAFPSDLYDRLSCSIVSKSVPDGSVPRPGPAENPSDRELFMRTETLSANPFSFSVTIVFCLDQDKLSNQT
jgi:hypothetical protein